MTASLLLHLHGPLQAWGGHARFDDRDTQAIPTASGLVGLLAAALGRPRGADVGDLAALSLAVRVDRPGRLVEDFHTVGAEYPKGRRLRTAEGKERDDPVVTRRQYLADAAFTVALTGDDEVVQAAADAIASPRWSLALGRRACPPAHPFLLGVRQGVSTELLESDLPVVRDHVRHGLVVDLVADDDAGEFAPVRDRPAKILGDWRRYEHRRVRRWQMTIDPERCVDSAFELASRFLGVSR